MSPQCNLLGDGRVHFSHGPIDLIVRADGDDEAVMAAHARAWRRFGTVLSELVGELPQLRRPVGAVCDLNGGIAQRMWHACAPHCARYITPMAAVAGAVAEEIAACYDLPGIERAFVNNGGDIALLLAAGQSWRIGLCVDPGRVGVDPERGLLQPDGDFMIPAALPVRGVATSGWRGRSFSLGIADSVTVLAGHAAEADAAATMIANAVNLDDVRIRRAPAWSLRDDTDLGDLAVTVGVPRLEPERIAEALDAGLAYARLLQHSGHIWGAVLNCQGQTAHLLAAADTLPLPASSAPGERSCLARTTTDKRHSPSSTSRISP